MGVYVGDCTTHLHRDSNKPLKGFLLTSPHSGMSQGFSHYCSDGIGEACFCEDFIHTR